MLCDPAVFRQEIDNLGIPLEELTKRLVISSRANLILPTHRMLDAAYEQKKGHLKIGSTLKGIGPTYTDKTSRNGLRAGDIMLKDFRQMYEGLSSGHLELLRQLEYESDISKYEKDWFAGIDLLKKFRVENTEYLINDMLSAGRKVLAEGAQGTMLDLDFGSYPYVTSSNTISAGACTGLGVSPKTIDEIFGIFKAYCTRVGSGPFPTELNDETGELLRKKDLNSVQPRKAKKMRLARSSGIRYAIMINGVTRLFMMKSDILSGFSTIKVCSSYRVNGQDVDQRPYDNNAAIEPVYTELPGWQEDITGIRKYNELPLNLRNYVEFIEKQTGIPITIVSVGPDRNSTIFR